MDHDETIPPRDPERAAETPRDAPLEDVFGLWLQRSLHALYDDITSEPIPPELLRLIEEDRSKRER